MGGALRLSLLLLWVFLAACAQAQFASKPFVSPKRWALVVGANRYQHVSPLAYAVDDAKGFVAALRDGLGFDGSTVKTLLDEEGQTPPTAQNLLSALDSLVSDARLDRGDLFVFYFAGHGVGTAQGDYLLPTDVATADAATRGVPVKSIVQRFVKAGLRNVLVIADACRDGQENPFGKELQELGREANIAVMLGTAPGGRSYEYDGLKHGIFTHQLLRALSDPTLRSVRTGALWASRLAARVQADVFDYTERDYGDAAQRPSVWSEKTQDVMLGAFIDANQPLGKSLVSAFAEEAGGLTKERYGAVLTQLGQSLSLAGQHDLAIEMLNTADQLGGATPSGLFAQGAAMFNANRFSECERVFDRLIDKEDSSYYRNMALLVTRNPRRSPVDRQKAALDLWKVEPTVEIALMAYSGLFDASRALRKEFAKTAAAHFGGGTRVGEFFLGLVATDDGKPEQAIGRWSAALSLPGAHPSANQLRGLLLAEQSGLGNDAECDRIIDAAIADGENPVDWLLFRADRQRLRGEREAVVATVREALAHQPEPRQMLEAVNQTLSDVGKLHDLLEPLGKANPYSWEALLAAGISASAHSRWTATTDYETESEKYAPDVLTARLEHYRLLDDITGERIERGELGKQSRYRLRTLLAIRLSEHVDSFGERYEPWRQFQMYNLDSDRVLPFAWLASKHLMPVVEAGNGGSKLRRLAMVTAMTGGDDALVDRIWKLPGWNFAEEPDAGWWYATYLAVRGRSTEALKVMDALPAPRQGTLFQTFAAAKILARIGAGKTEGARELLDAVGENIPSARQVRGLAYLALGDWKEAEPRLYTATIEKGWAFHWVSDTALLKVAGEFLKRGDRASLTNVRVAASARMETLFFREFGFVDKPDLSVFVGEYVYDVSTVFDRNPIAKVTLRMHVAKDGSFKVDPPAGAPKEWRFEGKVDAWGRVEGAYQDDKWKMRVVFNLPPIKEVKSISLLASIGTFIKMFDEKGVYGFWIAKPGG